MADTVCMYIDVVPNRTSPPAYLLRESYRDGGKVKKRTLANLSTLAPEQIEAISTVLRGEHLRPAADTFEITRSAHHGHVAAVRSAMKHLGFDRLISSRPSRERNLVCAMVAARILAPQTKLATTRWWPTATLAEDLHVEQASEDELYEAMDWLRQRQGAIEKALAKRHLTAGALVLYDLSSSYFEGTSCPLARLGHNRDGKRGKLQVNYGLTTDARGCPVSIAVFEGNTADAKTLAGEVDKLRSEFGIETLVLVGDRGMISHKAIKEELSTLDGLAWITALKHQSIRALVENGGLQLGLFDERNLFEFAHDDYPGERLVACRNSELKKLRERTRDSLLLATEKQLEGIRLRVAAKRLRGRDKIGLCVGKIVNRHKVAKHFTLTIEDDSFSFARRLDAIANEAALDGIYVLRSPLSAARMDADSVVRNYKALSNVERAFRSIKTVDLKVRPIHHVLAERVRTHIFLCMLAYYVEWHMREAWRPLLFADEDQEAKATRDPVAPAKRSAAAELKASRRALADGVPAHSFRTLLDNLSTIVRNTCSAPGLKGKPTTFQLVTSPTPAQQRALDLIDRIRP